MRQTILLLFYVTCLCSCDSIIIQIENGQVRGEVVEFLNKTIDVFTGIRYGKPPIGDLRFKRPFKTENWSDVYDATTKKYSCWQFLYNQTEIEIDIKDMNEDCLFLNVWAPHKVISNNTNDHQLKLKPVMVWYYGGALAFGSIFHGHLSYDGISLSTFDVVVVTINYRVGPLGFLYGGNDEAPGNVGLYDQLLGLKWVKNNIFAFGGNPNDITIFGESAGGWSVSYQILSPLSKGLFSKAIIQSGTTHSLVSFMSKEENLNYSKKHSQNLGCSTSTSNGTSNETSNDWIKCLKKVSPKDLHFYAPTVNFLPVYGEPFYPIKSFQAVNSGKFNSHIKILTGVTADEGSLFVYNLFDNMNTSSGSFQENVINLMNNTLITWKNVQSQQTRNSILDFYLKKFNLTNEKSQIDKFKNNVGRIWGDYWLTCPTYLFAKDISLWSSENQVYFYKLTHKAKVSAAGCYKSWTGVCHAEDIPFVFGYPLKSPQNYTEEDHQFTLLMLKIWTNFAKTGNPLDNISQFDKTINLPDISLKNITWPILNNSTNSSITKVFELHPKRFGTILTEPFKANCDQTWKSILYS